MSNELVRFHGIKVFTKADFKMYESVYNFKICLYYSMYLIHTDCEAKNGQKAAGSTHLRCIRSRPASARSSLARL